MIRIIGNDNSIYKQTTCRKCGSILEYAPIDVKERTVSDYTGDKDIQKHITCPACNNEVIV